eukprot:Gb_16893 [translate_table: standard]
MSDGYSLDKFQKAKLSVSFSPSAEPITGQQLQGTQVQSDHHGLPEAATMPITERSGRSNWEPTDWEEEPKPGVHELEVVKDGKVVDRILLDQRRIIFGSQNGMADYVLDHPSVSCQHAALVRHDNGRTSKVGQRLVVFSMRFGFWLPGVTDCSSPSDVYVIDLGSAQGTFIDNKRLKNDSIVKFEPGQSLCLAASSRRYILKRNAAVFIPRRPLPARFTVPHHDLSDNEATVLYNTILNSLRTSRLDSLTNHSPEACNALADSNDEESQTERATKRHRFARVTFRDEHGRVLAQVVGTSDGTDADHIPDPVGVNEGSLVGRYESLVHTAVIPKDQDQVISNVESGVSEGVNQKQSQYSSKVKTQLNGNVCGNLYDDSFAGQVDTPWAIMSNGDEDHFELAASVRTTGQSANGQPGVTPNNSNNCGGMVTYPRSELAAAFEDGGSDELLGDSIDDKVSS